MPVILIKLCLNVGILAHQDEVPDQVSLCQVEARGIQTLENHLRVVLPPDEAHIDNNQLLDSSIDNFQVGIFDSLDEEFKILLDSLGSRLRHFLTIEESGERLLIHAAQCQLVLAVSLPVAVSEVVIINLFGSWQRFRQCVILSLLESVS